MPTGAVGHTVPLPGTDWTVWRDALVRSAGFPVEGLERLADPECARIADAFLDGRVSEPEWQSGYAAAVDRTSQMIADIAADPLFREAVTWQNPDMAKTLRRINDHGSPAATREKARQRRRREDTVARYWQRYCGKNDTIGFFGPVAWATLDPAAAACDGRAAVDVTGGDAEALKLLSRIADRGIVRWGIDMPYNPDAERALHTTLAAIPDPAVRDRALAGLDRLDTAEAAVADAAGDPDKLSAALDRLAAEFTAITGSAARRRPGLDYAGRRLCYEETTRDIELTFGGPLLDALAGPLGRVLAPAARWLSATLAETYAHAFRALYHELLEPGSDGVPLSRYWEPARKLIRDRDIHRPADDVAGEFVRRWQELFELDRSPPGTHRVTWRSADLAGRVAELFPAAAPGWAGTRIHSPDLHICAKSAEALAAGEFSLVLGEMHAAWPTLDCAVFTGRHPDPARLRAAAAADVGAQFRPLYPTWWPRYTARIAPVLGVSDYQLAFAPAPGADPDRLVPITALTVTERGGALVATAVDGRSWPLSEVFALLVGWLASQTFTPAGRGEHTPRLTVDRVVVARETWGTTVGASGLATVTGRAPQYVAARRLRRELELPERVFVKIATEMKPVYVDFRSPRYVSALCTMLRTARTTGGDDVEIVISELLPGPEQAWLSDAQGRRYCSELRIHLVDPLRA